MDAITVILAKSLMQVWVTFTHNWPYLLVSVIISIILNRMMDPRKVASFFKKNQASGVFGAVAVAVTTPLCSCGTTAIILGMMSSMMPWSPIVAFMVSSPLTSPQELVYSAGLFGWPFAITFFVASIVLGLAGGAIAFLMESRGWLKNQSRFTTEMDKHTESKSTRPQALILATANSDCGCGSTPISILPAKVDSGCGCGTTTKVSNQNQSAPACGCGNSSAVQPEQVTGCGCGNQPEVSKADSLKSYLKEFAVTGKKLLSMFVVYALIGYLLNNLIPAEWVSTIFGEGNIYSVPLAATLGLPLYINSEASLPLVLGLIDGGMSYGSALAFLITGAGTSFGALAGMLTIARWRVVAIVVGTLWLGGMLTGMLYNLVF